MLAQERGPLYAHHSVSHWTRKAGQSVIGAVNRGALTGWHQTRARAVTEHPGLGASQEPSCTRSFVRARTPSGRGPSTQLPPFHRGLRIDFKGDMQLQAGAGRVGREVYFSILRREQSRKQNHVLSFFSSLFQFRHGDERVLL